MKKPRNTRPSDKTRYALADDYEGNTNNGLESRNHRYATDLCEPRSLLLPADIMATASNYRGKLRIRAHIDITISEGHLKGYTWFDEPDETEHDDLPF